MPSIHQTPGSELFSSATVPTLHAHHPSSRNVKGSEPMPVRAADQLMRGMAVLERLSNSPIAAVFGSARLNDGHPSYESARALAKALSLSGWQILTGAGPGIMEAANRGAFEAHNAGHNSLGVKVDLPREAQINAWVVDGYAHVYDFFVRKILLLKYADAVLLETGGFGTFDEAYEELAMVAEGRSKPKPIIGVGEAFWGPLKEAVREHFATQGASGTKDDVDLLQIASDANDAVGKVLKSNVTHRSRHVDEDMAFRLWGDVEEGSKVLDTVGPRVAVFGSSKFAPRDQVCQMAGRLGHLLGAANIPVVTCGASALTNAVNAGAKHNGGRSIGISRAYEPKPNGHVTDSIRTHYGCTAKVLATRGVAVPIFFPADFSTLDAAFEILTLHQTGKSPETPVLFVGKPWNVIKNSLAILRDAGTIEGRDIERVCIVDTADEAYEIAAATVKKAAASPS